MLVSVAVSADFSFGVTWTHAPQFEGGENVLIQKIRNFVLYH